MKLGINLVGISHLIHKDRHPVSRTYKSCIENYFKEVFNPLSKKFDVNVYLTTYFTEENHNIINSYKPKKALFLDYKNSHQIKTYIHSLDLMLNEELDYIIMTRFDISFIPNKIKELDIKLDKFNFLCKEDNYWENYNFVNDCFMIFPGKYLSMYKECCIDLINNPPRPGLTDMHGIYKFIHNKIGSDNINFMTGDTKYVSNCNAIYELKREQV